MPIFSTVTDSSVGMDVESAFGVHSGCGHVAGDVLDVLVGHVGLLAGDVLEAPEEQGGAFGELAFKMAIDFEALAGAVAVTAPVGRRLMGRDDGIVGAEAVLDGVAAGDGLAAGALRSAPFTSHATSVGSCGRELQRRHVTKLEVRLAVLGCWITNNSGIVRLVSPVLVKSWEGGTHHCSSSIQELA